MTALTIALAVSTAFSQERAGRLSGRVRADGSSTVAPILTAAAELFQAGQPRVQVTVGVSGTGGGFKKFLEERADLRTDISAASRPISAAELKRAAEVGVQFIELPIAWDGIAVVVHPSNKFCDTLTLDELRAIWKPGSTIQNWKDVRKGFPDLPMKLYGPGTDSGTFDYFVETIVGQARSCRSDYTASEDDNVLVQGVEGDAGALGYFGYSYYEANKGKLNLLGVARPDGAAVKPSPDTIRDGSYEPLSRPLFLYVNRDAAQRPEVRAFVQYLLDNARKIVEHPNVSYVGLGDGLYASVRQRLEQNVTGSAFADPGAKKKRLAELYASPKR